MKMEIPENEIFGDIGMILEVKLVKVGQKIGRMDNVIP